MAYVHKNVHTKEYNQIRVIGNALLELPHAHDSWGFSYAKRNRLLF